MPGSESLPVRLACPQNNLAESTIAKKIIIIINYNYNQQQILMPNCVPTCEMNSAQVVHNPFISYWVNIIVRIAKKTNSQLMCPLLLLS
jgi:hypothetical protein